MTDLLPPSTPAPEVLGPEHAVPYHAQLAARSIGACKFYGSGDNEVRALDHVDVGFIEGQFTAIMGPSGSGKSTLMHNMAGLDTLTAGQVFVDGDDVTAMNEKKRTELRRDKLGFIFQAFNLIGDLTVYENVELPLTYRGMPGSERKERVQAALERVGMAHRMGHYPSQLSGGQQQRVAVARAIVGKPLILLADEPTGNLDSKNGNAVMDLMLELHAEGATICMVTHDPRYAHMADRSIHLFDGQIVSEDDARRAQALEQAGFDVAT